jgi:hypothetical protein
MFDFCDRIVAFPLLCCILSALFLLLLLAALLTLFALDPSKFFFVISFILRKSYYFALDVNSSRRYYGVISTLSIVNQTEYIYGLDSLCNKYSAIRNCLNLSTSTSIVNVATTMIINRTVSINNYSYVSFILLCSCLIIYYIHRCINDDIM